jgi:hypothetical protein
MATQTHVGWTAVSGDVSPAAQARRIDQSSNCSHSWVSFDSTHRNRADITIFIVPEAALEEEKYIPVASPLYSSYRSLELGRVQG